MTRVAMLMVLGLWATPTWAEDGDGGVDLSGTWKLAERNTVVRFQEADGGWNGVIESSPRSKEVGFSLFRQLRQVGPAELRGTLAMPENGSTHEAVVTVKGSQLRAVVGAWIFSKTLEFERVK